MIQRLICFIYFLLLLNSFGYSQNYSYQQYTTEDGLPTNYVYGVTEDKEGNIWAFTENGVSKFNGHSFKNFSVADGLVDNDIIFMEADSTGVLWLHGLQNQIQYIKNDSVFSYPLNKKGYLALRTYHCSFDKSKAKYINVSKEKMRATYYFFRDGLLVDSISGKELSVAGISNLTNLSHNYFAPINKDNYYTTTKDRSTYFQLHKDSLYRYEISEPLTSSFAKGVITTAIDKPNPFIVSTDYNSIDFIDIKNQKRKKIKLSKLFGQSFKEISIQLLNKSIIIQTSVGYAEFDFDWNQKDIVLFQNDIRQFGIKRSIKDSNGNMWIGTRDAGLLLITKSNLQNTILDATLSKNKSFNKLYLNKENRIYSLSDNAELCKIDDDAVIHLSKIDLENAHIRNVNLGPDQKLIVSNAVKTVILDNTKTYELTEYEYFENLEKDIGGNIRNTFRRFNDIYYNPDNEQIFFSYPESNAIVLSKKNNHFTLIDINTIGKFFFHDRTNDILFISNSEGLMRISKDYNVKLEIKLKAITSLLSIDKYSYLIGTESNGLFHYELSTKKLTKVNEHQYIREIFKENELLYLASNEGVIVGCLNDTSWQHIYTFNKKDGLQSEEIRDLLIQKDYIYASSFKGIIKLDKQSILDQNKLNLKKDLLSISKVFSISKHEEILNNNLVLEYDENDISFSYHLQNFDSNGDIQYEYKLDPIQSEWQTTTDRTQRFFNLQAEDYSFHLKATDAFGHEYLLLEPYSFQIKNPFWKTWWFIIISIILLILGILYYLKTKADRSQREVEAEKKLNNRISSFKIEALRSQMNPHFVFNALSSIQYYIQKNNVQKADKYLTMFGGLIRKYLDFSQVKTITIQQEIDLLQDYLRLEEMRFESLFTSEIIVDPKLDLNYSYIPTMLVQPYIENAINHGLQQRQDGKGALWVEFKKIYSDGLRITISDNGIGIENSKNLKSGYHKSHGMNNIMDRISFLKESQELEIDLKINTLSTNPDYPGTQIRIEIKEI